MAGARFIRLRHRMAFALGTAGLALGSRLIQYRYVRDGASIFGGAVLLRGVRPMLVSKGPRNLRRTMSFRWDGVCSRALNIACSPLSSPAGTTIECTEYFRTSIRTIRPVCADGTLPLRSSDHQRFYNVGKEPRRDFHRNDSGTLTRRG